MKEIRDIKIDLLMGVQNPIVDLFNEITAGIRIINCDVYRKDGLEFIYFVPTKSEDKEWEWVFYQDAKNGKLWCNYAKYWSIFESNFNLKYQEVQDLTKFLVEEALNREVGTTAGMIYFSNVEVEEALNREVGTTPPIARGNQYQVEGTTPNPHLDFSNLVEEALKREIGTTSTDGITTDCVVEKALKGNFLEKRVEEVLKREIGTTIVSGDFIDKGVGEALKRETGSNEK
jgi:hypothetical protein